MSTTLMVVCLCVGLAFACAEAFIPGFGALGLIGLAALGAGVWMCFALHGPLWGALTLALVAAVVLLTMRAANRLMAKSGVFLEEGGEPARNSALAARDSLVGKRGEALTSLNPGGLARVDGEKLSVVSSGDYIEQGAPIRVIRVDGSHIYVCEHEEDGV